MTTNKRAGYIAALVAALVVLFGSIGLFAAYAGNGSTWRGASQSNTSEDSWRQGLGNGTMGSGPGQPMMGRGWSDQDGDARVSIAQAKKLAEAWLADNQPAATAGNPITMPMGYMFAITKDNQTVGTLMVDDDTGAVLFRQWSPSTTSGT